MGNGMYVGMSGASARLQQLDAIADNLANAETPGFKASQLSFQAVEALGSHGQTSQVYTAAAVSGVDLQTGASMPTGRPLDVVPQNNAFLAVSGVLGQAAYTRNGNIQIDGTGRLTISGQLVLGESGQAISVPPNQSVTIGNDGTVYSGSQAVDRLALVQLNGPVERVGGSLVAPAPGGAAQQVKGQVRSGELEHSNASPLQLTVELVTAQRQYETAMQAIQTYRTMDDHSNDLGRVR